MIAALPGRALRRAHNRLSYRECEVLVSVAKGLTSRAIGERLCIAPKTADNHVASILDKLGASNRAEAVVRGIRMRAIKVAADGRITIGWEGSHPAGEQP